MRSPKGLSRLKGIETIEFVAFGDADVHRPKGLSRLKGIETFLPSVSITVSASPKGLSRLKGIGY